MLALAVYRLVCIVRHQLDALAAQLSLELTAYALKERPTRSPQHRLS